MPTKRVTNTAQCGDNTFGVGDCNGRQSWSTRLNRRLSSRPICNIKFDKNCLKVQTIFGNYCRYTVTATSDGNKLSGANKDKGEVAAVRIKARYQSVQILPMHAYCDLLSFVKRRYLSLCCALEPILSVKAKEDLATALVRIMHKQQMAKDFLCDLIMSEVDSLDNEHLMFRGNSLATKAMEAYMKLVADDYLQNTLGDFVKAMQQLVKDCEVDPLKVPNISPVALEKNRHQLVMNVEAAWTKILNSADSFPTELRVIFNNLRQRLEEAGRLDLADTLISSSIFLRFLCPAILSPSLFNLLSEYPSVRAARNLTLVAKTLQTLANFTKFGGKEHYMEFMNEFVEREWDNMHRYLMRISSFTPGQSYTAVSDWTPAIDIGKEISLLHTYLDELWTQQVQERASVFDAQMEELRLILAKLRHIRLRSSGAADGWAECDTNTVDSTMSDYDNTSYQRNENCRGYTHPSYNNTAGDYRAMTRSTPATHLHTNDDYVLDVALLNDSLAIRQAGIAVQKHRNQRNMNDSSTREKQYKSVSDGTAVPPSIISQVFNNSHKTSNSTSTTASQHNDGEFESDDSSTDAVQVTSQRHHMRPSRRNRRRMAASAERDEQTETAMCAESLAAPSSSGYQSQNPSSSLSSSNSSSPVERKIPLNGAEPSSVPVHLPPPHKSPSPRFIAQHELVPSTSSSNWSSSATMPPPSLVVTGCVSCQHNTCSASSAMYREGSPRGCAPGEAIAAYDVPKSSLPRTNPHCMGRTSSGFVIKPTLVNIDEQHNGSLLALRNSTMNTNSDIKVSGTKWCYSEGMQRSLTRREDDPRESTQQDIIEQQKREIKRLMKENEELKRRVAAQKNLSPNSHNSTIAPKNQQLQADNNVASANVSCCGGESSSNSSNNDLNSGVITHC